MEIKVLSYNVRYGSEEDLTENSWRNRRLAMKTLLKLEDADLIATQEGLYQQIMEIEADLEQYNWCGEGREGGTIGEHMAIFYIKKIVLHCLKRGITGFLKHPIRRDQCLGVQIIRAW